MVAVAAPAPNPKAPAQKAQEELWMRPQRFLSRPLELGRPNVLSTETMLPFSHPNPENVDSYQAYSATEAISDTENFAIFAGAQLDLEIESPYTIGTPDITQVYHTYLSTVNGDAESELSSRVISVPRYEIIEGVLGARLSHQPGVAALLCRGRIQRRSRCMHQYQHRRFSF